MLSSLTRWPALTHSAVLGAVRAGGVIAAIYAFLYVFLPATGIEPIARLNLALASLSAMLMNTLGLEVTQSGTLLTLRGASVVVTDECNGMGAWLLIAGAMGAVSGAAWQLRILGMAASALAVTAVNITRIVTLCYLQAERPMWFAPVHEQIAPLFVVLAAAACFAVWLRGLEYADPR